MKKFNTTIKRQKKVLMKCKDGPYKGKSILMSFNGDGKTAILNIGGEVGFYKMTTRHFTSQNAEWKQI